MPAPADYVDVAQRIRDFYARFPDGSLQSYVPPYVVDAGAKSFVVYAAAAYRTPDDPRPGIGWAWEPVPGPTQFTRDSELMNAETSAWGRAIVALGFETKHIASRNEVQARRPERRPATVTAGEPSLPPAQPPAVAPGGAAGEASPYKPPAGALPVGHDKPASEAQKKKLRILVAELIGAAAITRRQFAAACGGEVTVDDDGAEHVGHLIDGLSLADATGLIDRLARLKANASKGVAA